MPDTTLIAVGCYTEHMPHVAGAGKGIEIAALNTTTGGLEKRLTTAGPRNPSYLAVNPNGDRLYSVEELDAADGPQTHAYALDTSTGALKLLGKIASPGTAACHISLSRDGKLLFVSNYVTGDLLCYTLDANGVPAGDAQVLSRPGKPNGHFAMESDEGLVLFCDAGNDTIVGYRPDGAGLSPKPEIEIAATPKSFPRHLALVPGKNAFLAAGEHAALLTIFGLANGVSKKGDELSSLPADWTGGKSGAAVRVHPNGRFGYMSNRGGHDSIFGVEIDAANLKLKPIGIWKTGGKVPRDFAIDPSGRWLIAAHQDSSDLTVFAVDPATGSLTETGHRLALGTPVSVLFL